jgi:hypothetical protein
MGIGIIGLLKNGENANKGTWNTMVTDRTKWLQKNLKKRVTEELGYLDAEELRKKSSQKNLEYNGYKQNKMVAE